VFDLLLYLLRHRERVVPKSELVGHVWQDARVTPTSLTRTICELRGALHEQPRRARWISTVHGRGYRFIGHVAEESAAVPASDPEGRSGLEQRIAQLERVVAGHARELERLRAM
jgi:DNA-binding winged helix-turn-helix (wHTH) protein